MAPKRHPKGSPKNAKGKGKGGQFAPKPVANQPKQDLEFLDGIVTTAQVTLPDASPDTEYKPQYARSRGERVRFTKDPETGKVSYNTERELKEHKFQHRQIGGDYWTKGYLHATNKKDNWRSDRNGNTVFGGELTSNVIEDGLIPWGETQYSEDGSKCAPPADAMQTFLTATYSSKQQRKDSVGANRLVLALGVAAGSNMLAAHGAEFQRYLTSGHKSGKAHLVTLNGAVGGDLPSRKDRVPPTGFTKGEEFSIAEKIMFECGHAWDNTRQEIISGDVTAGKPGQTIYKGEKGDLHWHLLTHPVENSDWTPLSAFMGSAAFEYGYEDTDNPLAPVDVYHTNTHKKYKNGGDYYDGIPSGVGSTTDRIWDMSFSGVCQDNRVANEFLKNIETFNDKWRTSPRRDYAGNPEPRNVDMSVPYKDRAQQIYMNPAVRKISDELLKRIAPTSHDPQAPIKSAPTCTRNEDDLRRLTQTFAACYADAPPRYTDAASYRKYAACMEHAKLRGWDKDPHTKQVVDYYEATKPLKTGA